MLGRGLSGRWIERHLVLRGWDHRVPQRRGSSIADVEPARRSKVFASNGVGNCASPGEADLYHDWHARYILYAIQWQGSHCWQQGGCDMRLEPQPTEVLSAVVGMLERFGASPQSLFDLEETIRIDRGKCVARSYRVDGLMAMWLMGIGIVQFYDADGNMLATINLLEEAVPEQMVA